MIPSWEKASGLLTSRVTLDPSKQAASAATMKKKNEGGSCYGRGSWMLEKVILGASSAARGDLRDSFPRLEHIRGT